MMKTKYQTLVLISLVAAVLPAASSAQTVYSEDFTQGTTTNRWYFTGGACLTAGTSSATINPGIIPSCGSIFNSYYGQPHQGAGADTVSVGGVSGTLPDPVGQGALRFTNGSVTGTDASGEFERGAIWSQSTFPGGQGLQITFKTVTYRGNSAGAGGDGADGMSFYLIDATKVLPGDGFFNGVGSVGGSLGYSCSNINTPSDGLAGGYIGLGIDEYGNFFNSGDNTASGPGFYQYGQIGLRGPGSITWAQLQKTYPKYYPSSVNTYDAQQAAVRDTCAQGFVLDYSKNNHKQVSTKDLLDNGYPTTLTDYAYIPGGSVQFSQGMLQIANEGAKTRPTGKTTNGITNGNVFVYSLKITQDGLLSFSYSVNGGASNAVITGQDITAQTGALPSSLQFGFAGSSGGGSNVHEIMCFQATPANQSASSAASDQKQTAAVQTTTQDYFAYYNPNDWTGRVTAYGLIDTAGVLTIDSTAKWDAQCGLTGVTICSTTGGGTTAVQPPNTRVMLTRNGVDTIANPGTAGIPFQWASLTNSEKALLTPSTRLDYLRGDRANEITKTGGGLYRARNGVLGDIVDSSPAWVGPPNSPYAVRWTDRLNLSTTMPENSATNSYSLFKSTNQGRLNVVYVGSNDGFLHGFRSGSEDLSGNLTDNSTTPNDGDEVLAYMPGAVLNSVHNAIATLDLSNTQYAHNFFVDATPSTGDVYYANTWHTWLVGGLGAGGKAIYALDITSPSSFAEANAASLVKGEWSSATISCVSNTACGINLGNTYGTPQIRRFHNGMWGAVFGNGYGSTSGDAGIYVMTIDQTNGNVSFYYMSTGKGSTATPNGIGFVTPADLDGDHITDFVYAGDLLGNVWRFDLTSNDPTNWAVTSGGPLFKTQSGQPITTQLVAASSIVLGTPQVMLAFGTGQRTQFTNLSQATYVNGPQSLYGVWDWNLSAWNTASTVDYASMTTAQFLIATGTTSSPYTLGISKLQQQTLTADSAGVVTTSNTPVVWEHCTTSSSCTAGSFGWYANLPGSNGATNATGALREQIVSNPSLYQGALVVNSATPANNPLLSCSGIVTDTGVLYALSATTGGTFIGGGGSTSTTQSSSVFTSYKNTQTVGLPTNETGTVIVANTVEHTTYLIGQNIAVNAGQPPGQAIKVQLPNNTTVNRLTWVELR